MFGKIWIFQWHLIVPSKKEITNNGPQTMEEKTRKFTVQQLSFMNDQVEKNGKLFHEMEN